MRRLAVFLLGLALLVGGCSSFGLGLPPEDPPAAGSARATSSPAPSPVRSPTQAGRAPAELTPTAAAQAAVSTATRLPSATAGPAGDPAPAATPSPTPCLAEECLITGAFFFSRPIAPPGVDTIDPSYRFGSTQGGQRDPHHGVEFLNPSGTPVLAAADGEVVVAGDDRVQFYGLYSYFYGNLVVVKHRLPGLQEPLYTLYGHLSEIMVKEGQQVSRGQEIGKVGMSGIATGSHLHFEVRYGENLYLRSSNPELWLQPHSSAGGALNGGMAARVVDGAGNPLEIDSVVLQHLPAPDQAADYELYLGPYEEKALLGQEPYRENLAAGDLEPGWYRLNFAYRGVQQRVFEVRPGALTVLTITIEGP